MLFYKFIRKYKLCVKIKHMKTMKQLNYLNHLNVKSVCFDNKFIGQIFDKLVVSSKKNYNIKWLYDNQVNKKQVYTKCKLPSTIKELTFGLMFNQPIIPNTLPSKLQTLTFGYTFNQPLDQNIFPTTLKSLEFGYYFNQQIIALPSTLQTLVFGHEFNKPIITLPSTLQTLVFGTSFNQQINENVLPLSLQNLTFGINFNQPINENVLPSSLQKLIFNFSQLYRHVIYEPSLKNLLPVSLKTLTFMYYYQDQDNTCTLDDILPPKLEYLVCHNYYSKITKNTFPNTLKKLEFNGSFEQFCEMLPPSLETLIFGHDFNLPIKENILPSTITELEFGDRFNQPIGKNILPSSLKSLKFNHNFNQQINENVLPSTLETLIFVGIFNTFIKKNVLPLNLKHLNLGDCFNQPLDDFALPQELENITSSDEFNKPIMNAMDSLFNNDKAMLNFYKLALNKLNFGLDFKTSTYIQSPSTLFLSNVHNLVLKYHLNKSNNDYKSTTDVLTSMLKNLNKSPTEQTKEISHVLKSVLPASLEILEFGDMFNQPFSQLPAQLKTLKLGKHFTKSLDWNILPYSLLYLEHYECKTLNNLSKVPPEFENLKVKTLKGLCYCCGSCEY